MPPILSLASHVKPQLVKAPPKPSPLRKPYVPPDVTANLISQYSDLVGDFTSVYSSDARRQMAAGRLLGVRGMLSRICPPGCESCLATKSVRRWSEAEVQLRAVCQSVDTNQIREIMRTLEVNLALSGDRFISALVNGSIQDDIPSQIGFLSAIDSIALHLAQRDLLLSGYGLTRSHVPAETKMRLRIVAMTLTLHRHRFLISLPAIRSYRETFGIDDLKAYPWWFVDMRLSERDLKWTPKRLDAEQFMWRFNNAQTARSKAA